MKISADEQYAIVAVLEFGRLFGYGNLISHLQTAWAASLILHGLDESTARAATGGAGYPFLMQHDLIYRGEWDETGARYRDKAPAGCNDDADQRN